MTDEVLYEKNNRIATISLNRPDKYNTLRYDVTDTLGRYLEDANQDPGIRVIILEGKGDAFCAGFDFSDGLEHFDIAKEEGYGPSMDVHDVTNHYTSYITPSEYPTLRSM